MTTRGHIDGPAPLSSPGADPPTATLRRRFPGAVVWFGAYTRRWWAMVGAAGRERLFEGADIDEITGAIISKLRLP